MSTPGTGGLPARRLDQTYNPPAGAVQPGSASGIFRGRLVVISGTSANGSNGLFVYSGTPAFGNLILSISAVAGTDQFGNPYPAGLNLTQGTISGSLITGSIGNSTIVGSTFTGGAITESTITFDSAGGDLLVYQTVTVAQTFTTAGPISFGPVAAGVTTLDVAAIGGGYGGQGGQTGVSSGLGGGGGEYAREPALAVTAGNTYTGAVGAGSAGGPAGGNGAAPGTASTFTGDSVTVTANTPAPNQTSGASGSTNTIHFNGGNGGLVLTAPGSGAGGGSSGGSSSAGNNGASTNGGLLGGLGGTAVAGGGAGGHGESSTGGSGTAGAQPGGGGGGGGATATTQFAGTAGGNGQVIVKYVSGRTLLASIAPVAGTDQFGNAYGAGIVVYNSAAPAVVTAGAELFASAGQLKYVSTDGNSYDTGRLTLIAAGQTVNSVTAATITGLSAPVAAGTYKIRGLIAYNPTVAAGTPLFAFTGPATSAVNWVQNYENSGGTWSRFLQTTLAGSAGPAMTLVGWTMFFEGTFVFTAAGTLTMTAATSVAADTFTITGNLSYLELYPVV